MSKADQKTEVKSEWRPSSEKVEEYRKLILKTATDSKMLYDLNNKKIKPSKSFQYLDQYAHAAAFWADRDQVIVQLTKLNTLLLEEAKKYDLITTNEAGQPIIKPAPDDNKFYTAHRKVLRRVLEREITPFLFQKKLAKLEDELNFGTFFEVIRNGYLFKDSGLRKYTHGDFTHPIQWLLLAWQLEDYDFFDNVPIISVYKSLGEENNILTGSPLEIPGLRETGVSIWGLIVDADPAYPQVRADLSQASGIPKPYDHPNTDPQFAVSPWNLHYFLTHNTMPKLSFLTSLISSREIKRAREWKKKLAINPTTTPKLHKENFPNMRYTLCSPNVLLPIDEKNPVYKKLALQTEIKGFPVSMLTESDSKFMKSQKQFMNAKNLFDQGNYSAAIKLFKNVEKDFVNLSISQQHNGYYYLGYAHTRTNQAAAADIYLRKALYIRNQAESTGKIISDFIPKENVLNELGLSQHIIRAKKDAAIQGGSESSFKFFSH